MTKRIAAFLMAMLFICCGMLPLVSCSGNDGEEDEVTFIDTEYKGTTLYVYNWGEYISSGRS